MNAKAEALYNACPTVKPDWSQLGSITQNVWKEKVLAGVTPADYQPIKEPDEAT